MTNVMTPLTTAQISTTFKTDYCENVIYENGAVSKILTEEAYITLAGTTPTYHYYLKDHQGNSRVVINQAGTVLQVNHYYPFGGLMGESTTGGVQPYKYNGKELDRMHGLDLFDYEARHYDAAIGRWWTVDPLAEKYCGISSYAYCANNPVKYIDPDGRDPIYAKNFWGSVKLIGDDGQKSTGSYLVRGSVAREVKAATKAGNFYTGNLSESKKVMHIPTGQIQQDVQQTATATINSGTSPETRVENGGHTLKGDKTARIWDAGTPMQTQTLKDGSTEQRWSVRPFKIGGKNNQFGGSPSDIQFFWHIHPNGSTPSGGDTWWVGELRKYGFTGNSFLIDVNNGRVTFFDEKGSLIKIKYDDFKRMGNQEEIK
jgi:RHS repeat-associated protein